MFALFYENLTEHIIIHIMQRSLMLKKIIYAVTTLPYGIQTRMKSVLQTKSGEINFSIILSPSSLSPKQYILLKLTSSVMCLFLPHRTPCYLNCSCFVAIMILKMIQSRTARKFVRFSLQFQQQYCVMFFVYQ